MKLYEIDQQLESLVNPETGEIEDFELFEQLHLAREEKIEGVACWIKNLKAESDAIKQEVENLKTRKIQTDNQVERLTQYLKFALNGEKFKTPKISISYRKSKSVGISNEEEFITWAEGNNADLLNIKVEKSPAKKAIKEAWEQGAEIPYVTMQENISMTIK